MEVGSKNIWKMNPKATRTRKKSTTFRRDISQLLTEMIRKYRYVFAGLIAILAGYGIFLGLRSRYFLQDADSALYFDLMSASGDAKNSSGAYGTSFWDLFRLIQGGELTPDSLNVSQTFSDQNTLDSHAYLISEVIHYLNFWPFDTNIFPHVVLTLSYVIGLFYIVYYFSVIKPIGLVSKSALIILIVLSPAFYLSLQGQNYMDRLFFGSGIYVVLNLLNRSRTRFQNVSMMIATLTSFAISERVSLILGCTIILSLFWRINQWQVIDSALLALGSTGVCWYFYWSSQISVSEYSSNTSLNVMKDNFFEALNGARTIPLSVFFLGNAVLLILASFNRRAFSLAIMSMTPNILVSVGGAELMTFLTHYHSIYMPILVAAAAIGLSEVRLYLPKTRIFLPILSAIIFSGLCSQLVSAAPNDGRSFQERILYSLAKAGDSFGVTATDIFDSRDRMNESLLSLTRNLDSDGITTPPEIMPVIASLGFSNLMYFPIGLGESEYVIAKYLDFQMDYPRDSAFGMVPEDRINNWGPLLQTILAQDYQRINQVTLDNMIYVLYQKNDF
jgi:hypothetical protein